MKKLLAIKRDETATFQMKSKVIDINELKLPKISNFGDNKSRSFPTKPTIVNSVDSQQDQNCLA